MLGHPGLLRTMWTAEPAGNSCKADKASRRRTEGFSVKFRASVLEVYGSSEFSGVLSFRLHMLSNYL